MKPVLFGLMALFSGLAQAQLFGGADWQEGPVPAPPAFNLDRLLRFEVDSRSALVYAIDPQTLSVSEADRVVRYVVVATSPSGVRNIFFEGLRCPTGQVKTYARYADGRWIVAADPPWRDMAGRPSRHAFALARQGACNNAGTPVTAQEVVRNLRTGPSDAAR